MIFQFPGLCSILCTKLSTLMSPTCQTKSAHCSSYSVQPNTVCSTISSCSSYCEQCTLGILLILYMKVLKHPYSERNCVKCLFSFSCLRPTQATRSGINLLIQFSALLTKSISPIELMFVFGFPMRPFFSSFSIPCY